LSGLALSQASQGHSAQTWSGAGAAKRDEEFRSRPAGAPYLSKPDVAEPVQVGKQQTSRIGCEHPIVDVHVAVGLRPGLHNPRRFGERMRIFEPARPAPTPMQSPAPPCRIEMMVSHDPNRRSLGAGVKR